MKVFSTFFKVIMQNKMLIIIFTGILVIISLLNLSNSHTDSTGFESQKPSIYISNMDQNSVMSKHLVKYLESNSEVKKDKLSVSEQDDALFFQDLNYIIEIPENYSQDLLDGKQPILKYRSSPNISSSFANMLIEKYQKIAYTYQNVYKDAQTLTAKIDESLRQKISVELSNDGGSNELGEMMIFYNFCSFPIMSIGVLCICMVLNRFRQKAIRARINVGLMTIEKHNRILTFGSMCFMSALWLVYAIISFFFFSDLVFTSTGLLFLINVAVFMLSVLCMAILIGSFTLSLDAIGGISNVVSLTPSFLCGSFVPISILPDFVVVIAHIFPTYYFVDNNDLIANINQFNFTNLQPIFINWLILVGFCLLFIGLSNIVSRKMMQKES